MFLSASTLPLLRAAAIVLLALVAPLALATRGARLRASLGAYEARLELDLASLRVPTRARTIAWAQAAALVLAACLFALGSFVTATLLGVCAVLPRPWLQLRRSQRTTRIEEQLDGWLFGLASIMRTTPAPGRAVAYSAALVAPPLRDELETLLKEQKLGTSLDLALGRMAARIGSRTVQSALGTLRIGQASGGEIPLILERSAATLREMARLEGVVRTKTAESKAQAWLLAVLPFPLVTTLHWLDPGFFAPLFTGLRGALVLAIATALWLCSILVARRISDVDI